LEESPVKYEVLVDGTARSLEIESGESGRLRVHLDNKVFDADAVEIVPGTFSILIDGRVFEARVLPGEGSVNMPGQGRSNTPGQGILNIRSGGHEFAVEVQDPRAWRGDRGAVLAAEGRQQIAAPMPGKIVRVLVVAGDTVAAGQGLLVVEAMKMQNEIRAPKSGKIERVFVSEGQAVSAGDPLVVVA
jgi:biotin carboxyl carrier protein